MKTIWSKLVKERPRGFVPALAFLRGTRAGAVGVPSVVVAVVILMGVAMVGDTVLVLHNRSLLQAAVDAGSIAAAKKLPTLVSSTDTIDAELEPLVRRYVLANLPENIRKSVKDNLKIGVTWDRDSGVVVVKVSAELGGAVIGAQFWGELVEEVAVEVAAQYAIVPVDIVLALDATGSMLNSILTETGYSLPPNDPNRRDNVVKKAAGILVSTLSAASGDSGRVAVGVVPFNTTVNIGPGRTAWVSDLGQGHKVIPTNKPTYGPWTGCIEQRAAGGDLDLSLVTPDTAPFTSYFYPSTLKYRPDERAALKKAANITSVNGENDWQASEVFVRGGPHRGCPSEMVELTTDLASVQTEISNLSVPHVGHGTMTHLGVVWGRRMLASGWRSHWGLPDEQDGGVGRKKVLVMLSDGTNLVVDDLNSYPGKYLARPKDSTYEYTSYYTAYGRVGKGTAEEGYLKEGRLWGKANQSEAIAVLDGLFQRSCQMAKDEGITVFTVSAVPRDAHNKKELQAQLTTCATSPEHAFVENATQERMIEAFQKVAKKLVKARLVNSL